MQASSLTQFCILLQAKIYHFGNLCRSVGVFMCSGVGTSHSERNCHWNVKKDFANQTGLKFYFGLAKKGKVDIVREWSDL